jgi:PAS domain S-box-containing protein
METPHQHRVLLSLAQSELLLHGPHHTFLEQLLACICTQLGISQASFWECSPDGQWLHCRVLHSRLSQAGGGHTLHSSEYPAYFEALSSSLFINAPDALSDPRTKAFEHTYLRPMGICSLLDCQVWFMGRMHGILCLEQAGTPRDWTAADEAYAQHASSLISQALMAQACREEASRRSASESNYQHLFHDCPLPMWVYDPVSLRVLDVNAAAVAQYGYSREEFLSLSISDLRPPEEIPRLQAYLANPPANRKWQSEQWRHLRKDGSTLRVLVASDWTIHQGEKARLVMSIDQSESDAKQALEASQAQLLDDLASYAFMTSHQLRGPLARMLGLINLLQHHPNAVDTEEMLDKVRITAEELDSVIGDMNHVLNRHAYQLLEQHRRSSVPRYAG